MNITLNEKLENLIQSQLQTDKYQNPEQVLEIALKLLAEKQKEEDSAAQAEEISQSPWDTLEALAGTIEAPEYWSSEHNTP